MSCSDDALTIDGSANVTTDSIATCGTADVPSSLENVVSEKVSGLTDIFKDLTPPTNNTSRTYTCTGKGQTKTAAPLAGTYTGGITEAARTVAGGVDRLGDDLALDEELAAPDTPRLAPVEGTREALGSVCALCTNRLGALDVHPLLREEQVTQGAVAVSATLRRDGRWLLKKGGASHVDVDFCVHVLFLSI